MKSVDFGEGGLIMFDMNNSVPSYNTIGLLAIILLGVIGGIFGSIYNYLVDKVLRTYSIINEKGPAFRVLLGILISILTSCCAFGVPWFVKCIPCPDHLKEVCPTKGRSGSYKSFQCPDGHYNDLASLLLTTNDDAIRSLFSPLNTNEFRIPCLVFFFFAMYFLGIITYGIAIPSGLFIPVILAGASYGRLVGRLLSPIANLDCGLFALLGSASFLGGTMRRTVSLCVILLELTDNLLMLPLMMLVLLVSKTVADCFNYRSPELCGLVLRSHLLVLLKGKMFTKHRRLSGAETLKQYHAFDFAKAGSGKGLKLEDLEIETEEMEMFVDHPITNTSPYTVVETMSLAKAAVAFRSSVFNTCVWCQRLLGGRQ